VVLDVSVEVSYAHHDDKGRRSRPTRSVWRDVFISSSHCRCSRRPLASEALRHTDLGPAWNLRRQIMEPRRTFGDELGGFDE
jgi:hypothetical protein